MNNKKILIVEDDVDILDAMQLTLEMEGYKAKAISRGGETARSVKTFIPNLIILDVLLSGKDGRTICKNLKNNSKTKNIPVLMVSAHPNASRTTMESGADAFLAKPFDIKELVTVVERLIN